MALDQGTTSSRAILFDRSGEPRAIAQHEFKQHYPRPGWVEHDPAELWESQLFTAKKAMKHAGVHCEDIAAIGITNQRETTLLWNRSTGEPIHNAIVWQDRRTTDECLRLKAEGLEPLFHEKTGLYLDPYFSATKIRWLLDHVEGARAAAEAGELAFGTVDSWLVWKLTNGDRHVTDVSNASRTLLYNINERRWDPELLRILNIPESLLPEVRSSSEPYGVVNKYLCACGSTIAGIAGDQQAALFGQGCLEPGTAKNTYGTGCFLLMNTGDEPIESRNKLLSTVAWRREGQTCHALEGGVFMGGATVQWLRDELGMIQTAREIQSLAASVPDTGGVCLVPAFAGLGAPHWDPAARGALFGLTRGSNKAHIARAAQEAICFQSMEVLRAMERDTGHAMTSLMVDGGASADDLLMSLQADLLQTPVIRPAMIETTAFGAAALAGLAVGFWDDPSELRENRRIERVFEPNISADEAESRYATWLKAVERVKGWAD